MTNRLISPEVQRTMIEALLEGEKTMDKEAVEAFRKLALEYKLVLEYKPEETTKPQGSTGKQKPNNKPYVTADKVDLGSFLPNPKLQAPNLAPNLGCRPIKAPKTLKDYQKSLGLTVQP